MTDNSPIDWSRVWELSDEIGAEEFAEVVELFLSETEAMVDELAGAAPSSLEEQFHALKGAALNLGFRELATLCATGEKTAASSNPDDVALSPILSSFLSSRREFLKRLRERPAPTDSSA